ncbi:putative RNA RNP-1 [Rosellinia necatrix]|uniref:Putative RNA RNP-1 n=1 Tax=Rosellinia necatrix TaxID=77044 RepID=A0A1W2TNI8_ROSNE|nr:putative RNA RNP-1 [Rosellinia necatrix]
MSAPDRVPAALMYTSAAQSSRWNRRPIPTGSSDCDDRGGGGGGGVSLTAASDFDDGGRASSSPSPQDMGTTPSQAAVGRSILRGDAKPFVYVPSPQPVASQLATSQLPQGTADGRHEDAVSALMGMYNQQRARSATTSAQQQHVGHNDHSRHSQDGFSTAYSSPTRAENRGHITTTTETETGMTDNDRRHVVGAAQQLTTGFPPSAYRHSTGPLQADGAARDGLSVVTERDNFNVPLQPIGTVNSTPRSYGIEGRSDAQVPMSAPAVNHNAVSHNNRAHGNPVTPAKPRPIGSGSDYQHSPSRGALFNTGSPAAANDVRLIGSPSKADHYQRQPIQWPPSSRSGTAHNQRLGPFCSDANRQPPQDQQSPSKALYDRHSSRQVEHEPERGQRAVTFIADNQERRPAYTADFQSPQARARANLMPYNQPQQSDHAYNDQSSMGASRLPSYLSPQHQNSGNARGAIERRSPRVFDTQNNPGAPNIWGYKYGLPGSVSDGSMSQYYTNGQLDGAPRAAQPDHQVTVGPLDLGMPTRETLINRSEMLQALTEKGQPALSDLMSPQFIPFAESYKYSTPGEENGVVVIRNIPYETTRGEIIALLGKSSKILNDRQEPIHIIMDRVTSKTQDAFCEISDLDAAMEVVNRFTKGAENGRVGRIGNRLVEIELSSQSVLMSTLFPSSRNTVDWKGTTPQIKTGSRNPWENFKSFFTEEEMAMLSKHVESPQRSLYARICPERPYECMISTLRKAPWYMAAHITIKQRQSVYEACMKMIGILVHKIGDGNNDDNTGMERLTPQLLDRLATSAMLCAGFSVVQKHNIATLVGMSELKCREFNQPRFADSWRHQWTLVPKAGMPIDVLEWYVSVIRAETNRVVQSLDISNRMTLQGRMEGVDGYWGFFWAEANFPTGRAWDDMTLAECSRIEWQAIERIVTRAIQGGTIPLSYTTGSHHINTAQLNRPVRTNYNGY